jgi:hypothetical protein
MSTASISRRLSRWVAGLAYSDLPAEVRDRIHRCRRRHPCLLAIPEDQTSAGLKAGSVSNPSACKLLRLPFVPRMSELSQAFALCSPAGAFLRSNPMPFDVARYFVRKWIDGLIPTVLGGCRSRYRCGEQACRGGKQQLKEHGTLLCYRMTNQLTRASRRAGKGSALFRAAKTRTMDRVRRRCLRPA